MRVAGCFVFQGSQKNTAEFVHSECDGAETGTAPGSSGCLRWESLCIADREHGELRVIACENVLGVHPGTSGLAGGPP